MNDSQTGDVLARRPVRRLARRIQAPSDFACPLLGHEGERLRLEWLQICSAAGPFRFPGDPGRPVIGEIPRSCAEAIGVDCTPLDRRDERGQQGTVWFRSDQSERIHRHRHYEEATP